jgi:integrase
MARRTKKAAKAAKKAGAAIAVTRLNQSWILKKGGPKLEEVSKKLGLVKEEPTPLFTVTGKGTDASESGRRLLCENRWKDMFKFFLLIGDYESALLAGRDTCPDTPPPIKPSSICAYLSYKSLEPGEPLRDPQTDVPIVDVNKEEVLALGDWNCPTNIETFQASINTLHGLYSHLSGEYKPVCKFCVHETEQNIKKARYTACDRHTSGACVRAMGDPMTTKLVTDHFKKCRLVCGLKHKRKGNVQLKPSEIRKLRAHLLSDSSRFHEGLKIYTMVIVGLSLFLRADELLSMKFDHFVENLQLINPNTGVRALVVEVKGKCDDRVFQLILWANDEFREFCPIRHLLLWIKLSGIKSGFLFPPSDIVRVADITHPMGYDQFLGIMKDLITTKLDREGPNSIFGTHVLRKTGYLFAIWGVIKMQAGGLRGEAFPLLFLAAIMKSARHKSIRNAQTYAKDSFSLHNWVSIANEGTNMDRADDVSVWKDIHIEVEDTFVSSAVSSRKFQGTLDKVAAWWFGEFLNLEMSPHAKEHEFLKLVFSARVEESEEVEFQQILNSANLSVLQLEKVHKYLSNLKQVFVLPAPATNPTEVTQQPVEEVNFLPAKKRRKHGTNDLEARHAIRSMPTNKQKAHALYKLFEEAKCVDGSDLTNSAKSFVSATLKPYGSCMELCYAGDIDKFSSQHKIVTSKKHICSGCKARTEKN